MNYNALFCAQLRLAMNYIACLCPVQKCYELQCLFCAQLRNGMNYNAFFCAQFRNAMNYDAFLGAQLRNDMNYNAFFVPSSEMQCLAMLFVAFL